MQKVARVLMLLVLCSGVVVATTPARAQAERRVTATATCAGGDGAIPTVTVTITNESRLLIHVPYLVSFSSPVAISARGLEGLLQEKTPDQQVVSIEAGDTVILAAPWAGREVREDEVTSALIITSAGLLLPSCGSGRYQIDNPNPTPVMGGEAGYESATAMAKVLGQLESFKAYPALYALLHADVRAIVPFEALACFYAAQYGPPLTTETLTVFSTDVTDVTWVEWIWEVNGQPYSRVAEVTYIQEIGLFPHSEVTDPMIEHFVRGDDGVWRWFFGDDFDTLNELPTACGLPAYT